MIYKSGAGASGVELHLQGLRTFIKEKLGFTRDVCLIAVVKIKIEG
jgi:hypothetical protein